MASVVVQRSPATTPSGGPPSLSPFVPTANSSPYSRPHPPTDEVSRFPGSFPLEEQSKEPKDAIDQLAETAPLTGGSALPVPEGVKQYLPSAESVQHVLAAVGETAKAYLPTSIGNALPIGNTDPAAVEAEVQNPNSYAVPSDLPTASSSTPTGPSAYNAPMKVEPGPSDTDSDIQSSGAQINNIAGLAGGTAVAGLAPGLTTADSEALTRSLAPSSIQPVGTSHDTTKANTPLSPPDLSKSGSTVSSMPAPTPPPKDSNINLPNPTFRPSLPDKHPQGKVGNDAASSTISNISSTSSSDVNSGGDGSGGVSGASGTISDDSGIEGGAAEEDGNGAKKKKAKRIVQKVKGKLHMGNK